MEHSLKGYRVLMADESPYPNQVAVIDSHFMTRGKDRYHLHLLKSGKRIFFDPGNFCVDYYGHDSTDGSGQLKDCPRWLRNLQWHIGNIADGNTRAPLWLENFCGHWPLVLSVKLCGFHPSWPY